MTEPDVAPIPKPEAKAKRGPYVWKRKRLNPVSKKKAAAINLKPPVREAVFKRDGGKCRLAPFFPDMPCDGPLDVLVLAADTVTACQDHLEWVTRHPGDATAMGLAMS